MSYTRRDGYRFSRSRGCREVPTSNGGRCSQNGVCLPGQGLRVSPSKKASSWYDLLESARTAREVQDLAKEYLESWSPAEIEALPEPCKPPVHFIQPEDVVDYAFEVVRRHCGSQAGDEKVAELAGFFGNAARRIAVLMGERSRPKARNDIKF
jgi:hypothetical protein